MLKTFSHQGTANQNHNEIPIHTHKHRIKRQTITSDGEDAKQSETSCTAGGM